MGYYYCEVLCYCFCFERRCLFVLTCCRCTTAFRADRRILRERRDDYAGGEQSLKVGQGAGSNFGSRYYFRNGSHLTQASKEREKCDGLFRDNK